MTRLVAALAAYIHREKTDMHMTSVFGHYHVRVLLNVLSKCLPSGIPRPNLTKFNVEQNCLLPFVKSFDIGYMTNNQSYSDAH